ncbi:cytochrome c oxidase assembly protein [uncultured Pseudokineococcus sp.]|uniref:cytochrome c oxidase assembly protein n=1 Tax=uncultured Pseudokineococcus sp. TaxID=1642928 RepID=UPI002631770F|nr:cytochrome c oxidase assembly protein [uncultured Pseudokineococcus sp.]
MEHQHDAAAHGALGWAVLEVSVVAGVLVVAGAYAAGLRASRHRSPWPAHRTALFASGLVCVAAALAGPLADAARTSFTAHMAGHLLLGMLGPLLLVLGAPVTLALRAMPVRRARALTRVLRSPPVRVLTHPAVAAVLAGGGLWVLYGTDLYPAMHASPLVHAAVHAHVLLAGYLFTASVVGVDPDPHRASVAVRSGVLVVYVAAHSVLAKRLYAHPPAGVDARDAEVGAQLMSYGGDVVDVALVVLVAAGWYAATRPREAAGTRGEVVDGSRPRGAPHPE